MQFGKFRILALFTAIFLFVATALVMAQSSSPNASSPNASSQNATLTDGTPRPDGTVDQTESVHQEQQPADQFPANNTQLQMRAKLASSQTVLEGLVTEDFEMIRAGARNMKSIAEAAHWPETIDEIYQHYSVAFRRDCDKLAEQAGRNDLQAAHYTYLHISTTCIDCHNYVRGRFTVEQAQPGGPVQLIPTQWDGPVRRQRPQPDDEDKDG